MDDKCAAVAGASGASAAFVLVVDWMTRHWVVLLLVILVVLVVAGVVAWVSASSPAGT